jgi:hypothetical protein
MFLLFAMIFVCAPAPVFASAPEESEVPTEALPEAPAAEAGEDRPCRIEDRYCVINLLLESTDSIENVTWRDQTYREIAKTLAFEGEIDAALRLIDKISTPDTKAMTIRGIGMAVAESNLSRAEYPQVFEKLRTEAEKIAHAPSYAIALTYIAMAQAFAGDNEGAWKTAASMKNDALRHKAYGETAEIQAEKEDFAGAMASIAFISDVAYRNKAYASISKILADRERLQEALQAAESVSNSYMRAQALQYILDVQVPRALPH